jgi:hypothetical protein
MRRIKINKWTAKLPDNTDKDETILDVIGILIGNKKLTELPKGIESFKIMGRIAVAFDSADKTGELVLEEREYDFLKKLIEAEIPCIWAMNKNLVTEMTLFLDAKEDGGK